MDFDETAYEDIALALDSAELVADECGDIDAQLSDEPCSDYGNANRLIKRYGENLRYVTEHGWHAWNGRAWDHTRGENNARVMAHQTALAIHREADASYADIKAEIKNFNAAEKKEALTKLRDLRSWAIDSGNSGKSSAMLVQAQPYLCLSPTELDADANILNVMNGILELKGNCDVIKPHSREALCTKISPVDYKPDAVCPLFTAFLEKVQPDEHVRLFLQRWCGYCLTGDVSAQVLVFFFGTGANGKSTFVDLMADILGPYAATAAIETFKNDERKRGGEATPDLARLPGVRFLRAAEPERGMRLGEGFVKSITSGEPITARHLNRGFFEYKPSFKITISGNHRPNIQGQDDGIWRRILLVPWEVTIPSEERDRALPQKLWAERSGVLNWMLDGLRMYLLEGLRPPESVRVATKGYREDSDPLGRFIEACVTKSDGDDITARDFYNAYTLWCTANGERPVSEKIFGMTMPERGFTREDGRVRKYTNIKVETDGLGAAEQSAFDILDER